MKTIFSSDFFGFTLFIITFFLKKYFTTIFFPNFPTLNFTLKSHKTAMCYFSDVDLLAPIQHLHFVVGSRAKFPKRTATQAHGSWKLVKIRPSSFLRSRCMQIRALFHFCGSPLNLTENKHHFNVAKRH